MDEYNPAVIWHGIGALKEAKQALTDTILYTVRNSVPLQRKGFRKPAGMLLVGPSGCGKTLLAKAVANAIDYEFVHIRGQDLLHLRYFEEGYYGDLAIWKFFKDTRYCGPKIYFLDEFEAMCPKRETLADSPQGDHCYLAIDQLLIELDNMEDCFVLASTHHPEDVDPAAFQRGRLDSVLYVDMPTPDDRAEILEIVTKDVAKLPVADDMSFSDIAMDPRCDGFTGSDLTDLVKQASLLAQRESATTPVHKQHFEAAFCHVQRSVFQSDLKRYEDIKQWISTVCAQEPITMT